MPEYSYDPAQINNGGFDQMRFELGDVEVEGGKDTTAMCDEEYTAMIKRGIDIDGKGWSWAKLLCLRAIMMRFSVESDISAGGMTIDLSSRYVRWKALYLRMLQSFQLPCANIAALERQPYFYEGMQNYSAVSSPFERGNGREELP